MATVQKLEELEIWRLAKDLYGRISVIANKMKQRHDFRFSEQFKGAAGSIMDNIAEGFGRNSRLEFLNSLGIAKGECAEVKSQLYRAAIDNYVSESEFEALVSHLEILIGKISALMNYLNNTTVKGLKFKDRKP